MRRGTRETASCPPLEAAEVQHSGDPQYLSFVQLGPGSWSTSTSDEPPLFGRSLQVPGVDPVAVARDCARRSDHACVLEAYERIEAPDVRDRFRAMRSLAALGRHDELRTALDEVPAESATHFSPFQAMVWRLDRGLEAGRAPVSSYLFSHAR